MASPKSKKLKKAEKDRGVVHQTEVVPAETLRPHPRNYKAHPDDQLDHIAASLRQHGFYRNVVVARDGTILAGHGVVEAATKKLGWTEIPVIRLDLDPESRLALKVLASDNELPKFAETDDRALTELLREVAGDESVGGLIGTGFDEQMLAALVMNTRPASEIANLDAAAEWSGAGMPECDPGSLVFRLVVLFRSESDRNSFVEKFRIQLTRKQKPTSATSGAADQGVWSAWYPPRERDDLVSVRWVPKKPMKDSSE